MPSIAQQDYIVIKTSAISRPFENDAAALSQIAGCISRGTIYDCLLQNYDGNEEYFTRIIGFAPARKLILYYDWSADGVSALTTYYTETQYQGLAAVQQAEDEKMGEAVSLPSLGTVGSYLIEDNEGFSICADGKYLIPAVSGGKLASLTIAETGPEEGFMNITWEDAQKLIGVAIL